MNAAIRISRFPLRYMLMLAVFALCNCLSLHGQAPDAGLKYCTEIRAMILGQQVEALSKRVAFPLARPLPIPAIHTPAEFILYYPTLFDDKLVGKLEEEVMDDEAVIRNNGSYALLGGRLWIDWQGNLQTVNESSIAEKQLLAMLIAEEKKSIHASIADFEQNMVVLQSPKFMVRIDRMPGGQWRYASWGKGKTQSDAPSLVLPDGEIEFKGTMGGERYSWKSGDYEYIVDNNRMAERDMMGWHLYVLKAGVEQVHEAMKALR